MSKTDLCHLKLEAAEHSLIAKLSMVRRKNALARHTAII